MATEVAESSKEGWARILAQLSAWRYRHRHWVGLLFILPWFIGFLWFDVFALVTNIYLSFTDFTVGARVPDWVGLGNYERAFTADPLIALTAKNTVYYMGARVPLIIVFSFSLALLLNANIRGRGFYRTIYYIPSLVPVVASSVIWLFLLRSRGGVINQFLGLFGIEPVPWLTRPEWAKPALVIMSLWDFGAQMVIYMAGLQGIPGELYEAAEIDGANGWRRLTHVTIPLMTPAIFFNLIMGIIGSFQVFASAYVMTGGGPARSTLFYMLYLYNQAFGYFRMGYASAMAVLLFIAILVLTLVLNRSSGRWVFYSGSSS
jgi:multiple sugar transport system permease protein